LFYELYNVTLFVCMKIKILKKKKKHKNSFLLSCFRVYVDAVLNHMTNKGVQPLDGTGGSIAYPNDRYFPAVPFLPEHTNRGCTISNITDPTVEEVFNK
jgi:hypothetical protein